MSSASPEAVVRAHLAAFSDHDLPAMLATMAADAVFVTGTTTVDPTEFDEFFGWAMRELDPKMEITRLVASGRDAACEFVETVTIDGARHSLDRAAFYAVEHGRIVSARVYDVRED